MDTTDPPCALGSILKRFGDALGSILKRFGGALGSILKRFGGRLARYANIDPSKLNLAAIRWFHKDISLSGRAKQFYLLTNQIALW